MYSGALWFPLGLFWTMYVARMVADTVVFPQELSLPRGEYFLYGLGTTFIPMLALFARPTEATLRLAIRLLIGMGFVALTAVLYIGARLVTSGEITLAASSGRFELLTLDPISLGHVGVALATASVATLRISPSRSSWRSAPLLAAVALGVAGAGMSASKGPLLALLLNMGWLILLDWRKGNRRRATLAAVILPTLGLQLAFFFEDRLGFGVISRFQTALNDPSVASVSVRLDTLSRAWAQFLAHPFLGSSLEERVALIYPHNLTIESFMAVGAVGGLMYLVFQCIGIFRAVRVILTRPTAAWVGILCLQYVLSSMFSGSLFGSGAMWALFAACIAISDDAQAGRGPVTSESERLRPALGQPELA